MKHLLDHPFAQHHPEELAVLLSHFVGRSSVLEVGSCFGHTLKFLAAVAAPKAKIRSIDLGVLPDEAGIFAGLDVKPWLLDAVNALKARGHDAAVWFGDSHADCAVDWAKAWAPFDLVFIDGDHSYDGVKADWENYGPMGKVVAFHDIAHPAHGVGKFWAEIKDRHKTTSCVRSGMGVGIVFQQEDVNHG